MFGIVRKTKWANTSWNFSLFKKRADPELVLLSSVKLRLVCYLRVYCFEDFKTLSTLCFWLRELGLPTFYSTSSLLRICINWFLLRILEGFHCISEKDLWVSVIYYILCLRIYGLITLFWWTDYTLIFYFNGFIFCSVGFYAVY